MRKILFLTHHPAEAAGTRYRVNQFVPLLEAEGYECSVWPFSTTRLFKSLNNGGRLLTKVAHTVYCTGRRLYQLSRLSDFDIVFIHREVYPFVIPQMEKFVLSHHPKVIFDFDDAVYAGHSDVGTLNHRILYRLKYGAGINEVLRKSSHVIAGNRILASYAKAFNANVTVIPTVVDCTAYANVRNGNINGKVTIGWMGSRSTAPYLKLIETTLERVAARNPGKVCFRFYGAPELRLKLPDFVSGPFSLDTEIADLRSFDIGLMPLPDTEWTRGKCGFKAIQYMATGAVPVASPVGIVEDLLSHGVNGLVARNNEEWFSALQLLIDQPSLRERMSRSARHTVEDHYSIQTWGPKFVSLIHETANASRDSMAGLSELDHKRARG